MLKDRPATLVTVIGSGLVKLDDDGLALTIYTYQKGSIGFRLSRKAIEILRETLDEAEAELARLEPADHLPA